MHLGERQLEDGDIAVRGDRGAVARRALVVTAAMVSMFMVAVETTIVSAIMPVSLAQTDGSHSQRWVVLSFLLSQTAMTLVFGRLADRHGRRPVVLLGTGIFMAGSVLAGAAWSTTALVIARSIQGAGAGAVQTVAMTIVADLYPGFERCKFQGYLTSVWATSVVLGPLIGDLIVDRLAWSWIFWLSVPVGVVALAGFLALPARTARFRSQPADIVAVSLFVLATAALMIALTESTGPAPTRALLAGGLFGACSVLFIVRQVQARDPMIPFWLWGQRSTAAANGAILLAGMAFAGTTTLLPVYMQSTLGPSSLVAGLIPTMAMVGWLPGAMLAVWINRYFGPRQAVIGGSVLVSAGAMVFVLLTPQSSPAAAGFGSFTMGAGMSLISLSSLVLIQGIVGWSERCSATASNLIARNLGNVLGVTILGATLSHHLDQSGENLPSIRAALPTFHAAPLGIGSLNQSAPDLMIHPGLQQALHFTFWTTLLISLAALVSALRVPSTAISAISDERSE